jgi:hypothetical protein
VPIIPGEHKQIVHRRSDIASIPKLPQPASLVDTTLRNVGIEKFLGVSPTIRHLVAFRLIEEPFHKLDALPFLPPIISSRAVMSAMALERERPIVINRDAFITVDYNAGVSRVEPKADCANRANDRAAAQN